MRHEEAKQAHMEEREPSQTAPCTTNNTHCIRPGAVLRLLEKITVASANRNYHGAKVRWERSDARPTICDGMA